MLTTPEGHQGREELKVKSDAEEERVTKQPKVHGDSVPVFDANVTHTDGGTSTCKCHHTNGHKYGQQRRNLVVCIDGTSNQFSDKNTNVVEFYSRLTKDENQLTFYNSGIGTYATPSFRSWAYWKQAFGHKVDLAIAWNFERILLGAYRWLAENYRKGDCIFLFGFSRGAYQVRVISAMIEKVGLIHKGNEDQIPFAYELYASSLDSEAPNKRQETQLNIDASANVGEPTSHEKKCKRFKKTFAREVMIHFVGAWDTVSSVGIVRDKTLPFTNNGMDHVCAFRHALALDERRVKFMPEYAQGGLGVTKSKTSHVKEVWFAGSHSDIGGGNTRNDELDQFGPALRWMTYEAIHYGIQAETFTGEWKNISRTESLTWVWWLIEYLPIQRLSYRDKESTISWPPHRGTVRHVQRGQRIHESVIKLIQNPGTVYKPKAILHSELLWDGKELDDPERKILVERDPYMSAEVLLSALRKDPILSDSNVNVLSNLITRDDGRLSLVEHDSGILNTLMRALETISVEQALTSEEVTRRAKSVEVITRAILSLRQQTEGNIHLPYITLLPYAKMLCSASNAKYRSIAETFMASFATAELLAPFTHDVFWSAAFSSNGKLIVSGSHDKTVRVWDTERGDLIHQLEDHTDDVSAVAFSPDDKWIASGSLDKTIRVWDVETGEHRWKLEGHRNMVLSVAFSPDSKSIVSGSSDSTIHVWNTETGETTLKLEGHRSWVRSVAFSPDGTLIVSGSSDKTVRVWSTETGESIRTLEGHIERVLSVTFSSDSKRIISGSGDTTIRVWNADTGELETIRELRGHDSYVLSVAVSHDDKFIVSGSADQMIRVWDLETGKTVLGPLVGHKDMVWSLAFSRDGKKIVSASWDGTVRVWDATLRGTWKEGEGWVGKSPFQDMLK